MGKNPKSSAHPVATLQSKPYEDSSYEGERLDELLLSIQREIKTARGLNAESLPEKFWLKFAIGVNEVTRALERMTPCGDSARLMNPNYKACKVKLQVVYSVIYVGQCYLGFRLAILLTANCNPRWLTNHVPCLAMSRKVPLILVKDKEGSLRLGELVNLKTAIAIGIKSNGSPVNQLIDEILQRTK
ncbi:uncharacterized protein LOC103503720 isoform X3 [Cucumis melo]|uniref:Uncharacterized protein LOC103503720 isoform X3 n=1 Tax=Cucumis melo TaxID=3656 RepID=A0A1S3CS63_CUCME|nr:uncharacterized protein LOC103503720 isoform X3 [Cucumis melo]